MHQHSCKAHQQLQLTNDEGSPSKHQPRCRHHLCHRRMLNNHRRQQATRRYKMSETLERLSLESDFHEAQLNGLRPTLIFNFTNNRHYQISPVCNRFPNPDLPTTTLPQLRHHQQ
ncbi:hypothetical protein HELRODRAFT_178573 [Helobdella robusta]|uniref:Uncharacterized protein n=1 Tax=Helobdella robusta TaxID=6412 RepID=T1FDE6_HELRO|nr:hypothetical protein HELRODRAFT_178573 [Helobdella robusta]ESN97123.1 hypothetical protein HELRODRAFT_178573 [Helobdella robusta]